MAYENSANIGVLNSYGVRGTEGKFGGVMGETGDATRKAVFDLDFADIPLTTGAAKNGLDFVFPTGTKFLRSNFIVKTGLVGPTGVDVGLYTFDSAGAITAVDADGLHTAAVATAAALVANASIAGVGAMMSNGAVVTTAPTILRTIGTVAAATAGKMRLVVEYNVPSPVTAS